MSETNTPTPTPPSGNGMSGRSAFKIGCMITLGVFAACFLAFCALPAACTMGTVGSLAVVGAAASSQATTGTTTQTQENLSEAVLATPAVAPATPQTPAATPDPNKPMIGLTKEEIIAKFSAARRDVAYETNVDPQAVKLVTDPITIIVYFNNANLAEGVAFLSNSGYMGDPVDGNGSYVHQNYQMLYNVATGGAQYPVKANSSTRFPVEVRIGTIH